MRPAYCCVIPGTSSTWSWPAICRRSRRAWSPCGRGAALIAAVGLSIYPNIESTKSLVLAGHVVKPDPAPRATYDDLYAAYRQVYRSLRGLYHTLNRSH